MYKAARWAASRAALALCGVTVAALAQPHDASAQDVAQFYAGKTVRIIVAVQEGTGFDLYARVLARHYGRNIPGAPSLVVQNMVGASGLTGTNFVANIAPKDGTVMATVPYTVPFEPLLEAGHGQFDATKLTWIGNMDASVSVCTVAVKSGISRFVDLFEKDLHVGATGAVGPLAQTPRALKALTGAKFIVVDGYKGSADVRLAIQRGEIGGVCGISLSTVRTQYADVHQSGEFKVILQVGPAPHPDIPDVPHVHQFAKTEEDRQVFDLIFGTQGLGRSYVAAAGIPEDRATALRKAFMATMSDAEFLADAAKAKLDLRPQSGEEVQAFVTRLYASPKAVVERARKMFAEFKR
jgi:tripartite-type tricarboxylate transporter receptor subunit TctC